MDGEVLPEPPAGPMGLSEMVPLYPVMGPLRVTTRWPLTRVGWSYTWVAFATLGSPTTGVFLQRLDCHHLLLWDERWLRGGDAHPHCHVHSCGRLFFHRPQHGMWLAHR